MARKLERPRPRQGARLAALRALTEIELAQPVGESQLPRKQHERIVETVAAMVAQYERGA